MRFRLFAVPITYDGIPLKYPSLQIFYHYFIAMFHVDFMTVLLKLWNVNDIYAIVAFRCKIIAKVMKMQQ